MQIVIDIPDEVYQDIQARDWKNPIWARDSLMRYIHEGVVLPEHHGRLIDADALLEYKYSIDSPLCVYEYVVDVTDIDNIPTIIEADKEEEQ